VPDTVHEAVRDLIRRRGRDAAKSFAESDLSAVAVARSQTAMFPVHLSSR
jgi:hypothetical protein